MNDRLRITLNLVLATFTSFVDCVFPNLYPDVTKFLVKKVYVYIDNGVSSSAEICGSFSASTGESCVVDETFYDESERNDEQESKPVAHNELQPNASENE